MKMKMFLMVALILAAGFTVVPTAYGLVYLTVASETIFCPVPPQTEPTKSEIIIPFYISEHGVSGGDLYNTQTGGTTIELTECNWCDIKFPVFTQQLNPVTLEWTRQKLYALYGDYCTPKSELYWCISKPNVFSGPVVHSFEGWEYIDDVAYFLFDIHISENSQIIAVYGEVGPEAQWLLENIYLNPDDENLALHYCEIDINDWPLSKDWIDTWIDDPVITLSGYAAIDDFQVDINNQRWPTGVTVPRELDPWSGTWKHYYGTNLIWDVRAAEFRKAIAHLADKDAMIRDILKGYGYKKETVVPVPALAGYTDYDRLQAQGLIYEYDPCEAAKKFDTGGFVEGTTNNPYFDPDFPCSAEKIRIDPRTLANLEPLEFYIRLDDPRMRDAGIMLRDNLRKMGIPVNDHITEKSVCLYEVKVLYDYHLYLGEKTECQLSKRADTGKGFIADPDWISWLFHSRMYYGGSETSYYDGIGRSPNYVGFCHPTFDSKADAILSSVTAAEVREAVIQAQEEMARYCPVIPLWCSAAVKAYKTAWQGTVHMEGVGKDNYWSFLNMYNPNDDTIDWGFKSNLESLNVICVEQLWDWKTLGLIYDGLVGPNPYDWAEDVGFLADGWETGPWETGMYCNFTLKPGVLFHDGTPVTPYDVAFSQIFPRDCGPGVCWYISNVNFTHHVEVQSIPEGVPSHPDIVANPHLGPDDVVVYLDMPTYWALHWGGGVPVLNSRIWLAANQHYEWGWPGASFDRFAVCDYHPWEHDIYDATTQGMGADGTYDLCQDGAGAWIYDSTDVPEDISAAAWVLLQASREYYMSQEEVRSLLTGWFHKAGNVNYAGSKHEDEYPEGVDECIDIMDGSYIMRAWGTDPSWPHGISWSEWNEDCDFNEDLEIDVSDLYLFACNFGRYADG